MKVVRDAFAAQVVDEGWSGNYFDYCKKVLIVDKSATGWRLMIKSAKSPTSLVHQSETEAQIEERFKRITQRSMKQFRKLLRTTHVVVRFDNDEPADEEIGSSSDDDEWLLEKSMQVLGDDESALDLPSDSSESEYGLCGRPVAKDHLPQVLSQLDDFLLQAKVACDRLELWTAISNFKKARALCSQLDSYFSRKVMTDSQNHHVKDCSVGCCAGLARCFVELQLWRRARSQAQEGHPRPVFAFSNC